MTRISSFCPKNGLPSKEAPKEAFCKLLQNVVPDAVADLDMTATWSEERAAFAYARTKKFAQLMAKWLSLSRERSNFTYSLRPVNRLHLAGFVAAVASIPLQDAMSYITEIEDDVDLVEHYKARRAESRLIEQSDPEPRWGRRLGWYALVRALKPALVVETGVHFGLGAIAIASALRRNARDGSPGRYIGLEILPQFGWLVATPYSEVAEVRYGKSLDLLTQIDDPIDLFLHDSDHSYKHEMAEFVAVEGKLSRRGILLSDNSYTSTALYDYARQTDRRYLHFQEQSFDHFYPGAGFSAAWRA